MRGWRANPVFPAFWARALKTDLDSQPQAASYSARALTPQSLSFLGEEKALLFSLNLLEGLGVLHLHTSLRCSHYWDTQKYSHELFTVLL